MKLTLSQEKAVKEIDNNLQIIACAGSGKTEVITRRIVNILTNNRALPKDIVAFTFTEKAAASMKKRIINALTEENYVNISEMDDMYIGTIHGYCFSILKKYSEKYQDFRILDSVKNYLYIKKNFEFLKARSLGLKNTDMDIKLFLDCISKLVDDYENKHNWSLEVTDIFDTYTEFLYKDKYLDFATLILEALKEMKENLEISKYLDDIKYLIVDEYQDVDDLQEKIIKIFYNHNTNICVVGDDDQTIYQFRGSNADNMISFSERYKNVVQVRLEENFRSTTNIVKLADAIIKTNTNRLSKTMFSSNDIFSLMEGRIFDSKNEEYDELIEKIERLHKSGTPYNEMAILIRKNKYINEIVEKLSRHNIPYETDSADYFFKGLYFNKFCQTLNILTDLDKTKLYDCWSDLIPNQDLNKGYIYLRRISRNGGNRNVIKLTDIMTEFLESINFFNEDIEQRKIDLESFNQILNDFDEIYKDNQLSFRISNLLRFLEESALEQYKYHKFNNNLDDEGINIMSIHKSKGLEFHTVFILGMEKGEFPSTYNGGRKYYNLLGEYFKKNAKKYESNIEDERKLFYVALTRAKNNLFIYSQISKKDVSEFFIECANSDYLKLDYNSISILKEREVENMKVRFDYNKIKEIRKKVLDYYGTAMHFHPVARMDLDRCAKLDTEELLEEAIKLKIISRSDINNLIIKEH